MKTKEALQIIEGLSKPSKMPCPSYSIPATACITGSLMAKKTGSVCSKCYARKGMYNFPVVKAALARRLASLKHPQWVDAMITAITSSKNPYFRWHDSGDLQGPWHLKNIIEVANRLPNVKFWLPTKEVGMINDFVREGGMFPDNLCVRVSGFFLNVPFASADYPTANVSADKEKVNCHAPDNKGKCGDCRKCWDKTTDVTYKLH